MSAEVETLKQFYAALNRNDLRATTKNFGPQRLRIEPEGFPASGTYSGVAGLMERFRTGRGAWAEGACDPELFLVPDDKIVVYTRA